MKLDVILPKWGMGIDEGTIVGWLKSEGDRIEAGEPLVEVETAKSTQEIEAEATGVLAKILVAVGETVAVGATMAVIETADV